MPNYEKLIREIKAAQEASTYSQAGLARAADISPAYLSLILNLKATNPNPSILPAIADILGMKIDINYRLRPKKKK